MGRVRDYFEFVNSLEKEEGYNPNKKIEKGFYLRTMGLSVLVIVILVVMIVGLHVKL
ncbi:MAG: hypothetical protein Q8920_13550 [Bacillota bacterium]|nr:hypothetical protein [Bacillota bacterium]